MNNRVPAYKNHNESTKYIYILGFITITISVWPTWIYTIYKPRNQTCDIETHERFKESKWFVKTQNTRKKISKITARERSDQERVPVANIAKPTPKMEGAWSVFFHFTTAAARSEKRTCGPPNIFYYWHVFHHCMTNK